MSLDLFNTANTDYSYAGLGRAERLKSQLANSDVTKAEAAAVDFEAVFISQMLRPMFDTIETDGLFGGGPSEKIFRSMFVDEAAKEVAKSGGVGIADSILKDIIALQEASDAA